MFLYDEGLDKEDPRLSAIDTVVKFKRLNSTAVLPRASTNGAACMDLVANRIEMTKEGKYKIFTGLAMELEPGWVGLIFPRSSICKTPYTLTNSVAVIDSDFRGDISAVFSISSEGIYTDTYEVGARFAQLMIQKLPSLLIREVDELSSTERGSGGFGHTGLY